MATFSDNFTRADAANLGANWTAENSTTWAIVSNQASASATTSEDRANTDLGAPNMFVQADKTSGGNNAAICARWTAGTLTFYFYRDRPTSGGKQLVRNVAGTPTVVASGVGTSTVPFTERLEVNGPLLVCYTNGVETIRATNTVITTGNFGGLKGSTGVNLYDNYQSGSLNALYPNIIMY